MINIPTNLNIPPRLIDLVGEIHRRVISQFGDDTALIWFGSWAKGTARPQSDIDLAVDSPRSIGNVEFAALRDWVDDLRTLYSIDMVNLSEVGSDLRQEIEKHGIRL